MFIHFIKFILKSRLSIQKVNLFIHFKIFQKIILNLLIFSLNLTLF